MQAIQLRQPGGPVKPARSISPIRERLDLERFASERAASSLNYHDLAVVSGPSRAADRRIPMSDGAGVGGSSCRG